MKKVLIILFTLCFILPAFAHSPSNIIVEYNKEKKELDISIEHAVYDPKTHYIKNVTILKNNRKIIADDFKEQQNKSEQVLQYIIRNLKKGDNITVKADCSVHGSVSETITISE
jgi:desulfoferrodoxin (superoxide reductase-like protein)